MCIFFQSRMFQQGSGWVLLSASLFFLAQCGGDGVSEVNDGEDPLYRYQWHLNDPATDVDVNAPEAWEITEGEGIIVGVLDDGAIINHPDLKANHSTGLSYDYVDKDLDPHVDRFSDASEHGTAVSGLIVGVRGNGIGGSGVSPKSEFFALNALYLRSKVAGLIRHVDEARYAVSNNSWGPTAGGSWNATESTYVAVFEEGIKEGFGGKGIFYVTSAGNDRQERSLDPASGSYVDYVYDNTNFNGLQKHHGVAFICAVSSFGEVTYYSEPGASLLVCGPSNDLGIDGASNLALTTTDMPGLDGYNRGTSRSNYKNYDYTNTFGGTSGSAPVVSGVVALIRSANKKLTWRDVRLILASTAKKVDTGDPGWFQGVASYDGTKVGSERYADDNAKYNHSHDYGFGLADAERAVKAAKSWERSVGGSASLLVKNVGADGNIPVDMKRIPDGNKTGKEYTIDVTSSSIDFIEAIKVNIWVSGVGGGSHSGDLRAELTSPADKTSILAEPHGCFDKFGIPKRCPVGGGASDFLSLRHLGESSVGVWTLKVADEVEKDIHQISGWQISFYGHKKQ